MAESLNGRIVIIGAGHAGGSVAALLRQYGWTGPVMLAGAENWPPYQRPPLSKGLLLGKSTQQELQLKPDNFYVQRHIDLACGRHAVAIDRVGRQVQFQTGEPVSYDHLVIATGARLRALEVPGNTLDGVMSLRTADDALQLRATLRPGLRIVVVGGGFIGLEAAASALQAGAEVRVIERESRLMARVASRELSEFVAGHARTQGVTIELNASVDRFIGAAGQLEAVELADRRVFACDLALVGIGVLAQQSLAEDAGLDCEDGIRVDAQAATSDPCISAIGDCTRRPVPLFERSARLESVHNAMEQAKQVAARLCGKPTPVVEAPWTWSDQFDLRLQMAGLISSTDQAVVRGDPTSGSFAVFHVSQAGVLRAVEAVNAPMDFAFARMAIGRRLQTPPERLGDPMVALKELALS